MKKLLLTVAVMLALTTAAFSQTAITRTTLSAAISDERVNFFTVASATGFVASTGQLDYGAFIDKEFFRVISVSSTRIGVMRGLARTTATPHKSGATVYVGKFAQSASPSSSGGPFIQTQMSGSCTRSTYPILPLININVASVNGQAMYNCLNGVWLEQTLEGATASLATKYCSVPIGSVAYGSAGTSTTFVSGTVYVASVNVPQTTLLTGASVLVNGTVATNNFLVTLYDAGGTLLANSALAGAVTVGANTFNDRAFTSTYLATGPARYFVGVQGNGTTDGIRTVAASTFITLLGNSRTGTFGTVPNITVPTSLTADTAPYACLY